MPSYVNPFNPQTPIGESLNNIAIALFANNPADKEALAQQRHQHSELYRVMGQKALREAEAADAMAKLRSPDAMDENVAWRTGTTLPAIRAARDYMQGRSSAAGTMPPAGPVLQQIGDTMFGVRTGMADKTVNALEIAKALGETQAQREREGIIAGTSNPTSVSQAHFATSGKAPFDNMGNAGTFNQVTGGDQSLNPVGTTHAAANTALAASRNALATQRNTETRAGVKIGAPVPVNDPEAGNIFTSPLSAVGRQPGYRPEAPGQAALRASQAGLADARAGVADARADRVDAGTDTALVPVQTPTGTVWMTRDDAARQQAGAVPRTFAPPRDRARTSLSNNETKAMAEAFTRLAGGSMDPNMAIELSGLATSLATDPSSPYHRNPIGAAQQVWNQNQGRVQKTPWWKPGGMSLSAPAAQAQASAAAPGGAASSVGGLPPQAASQLREGVQTTFKNGQTWSLIDGVPKRIK